MVLPAIRADHRIVESHRSAPGPLRDCPITVLTGDADPKVTAEEARAWQHHTTSARDRDGRHDRQRPDDRAVPSHPTLTGPAPSSPTLP